MRPCLRRWLMRSWKRACGHFWESPAVLLWLMLELLWRVFGAHIWPQAELSSPYILTERKTKPNLLQHTIWWLYILMHCINSRELGSQRTECDDEHPHNQSMEMQRGYEMSQCMDSLNQNGTDNMRAGVIRRILNGNMGMFGRTHEKLWRIWDYGHPMEWMIPYDGHRGSCSV